MKELSLYILDIAQNSVAAGGRLISVALTADTAADLFSFEISDDGRGMSAETLKTVTDPFTTSRKTRKVGLGLGLLKSACEQSGGRLEITSAEGRGTTLWASFGISHIDRVPLGDIAATVAALVNSAADYRLVFSVKSDYGEFALDSDEIKSILDGLDIRRAEVAEFVRGYVRENTAELLKNI